MFRKKNKSRNDGLLDVTIVEEKPKQLIEVKDIKELLVLEFERSKTLEDLVESKNAEIERLKEVEFKYKACLVLLDEYKERLKNQETKMSNLHKKIEEVENLRSIAEESKNDAEIRFRLNTEETEKLREQVEIFEQENHIKEYEQAKSIRNQVSKHFSSLIKQNLAREVANQKGVVSKAAFVDLLHIYCEETVNSIKEIVFIADDHLKESEANENS